MTQSKPSSQLPQSLTLTPHRGGPDATSAAGTTDTDDGINNTSYQQTLIPLDLRHETETTLGGKKRNRKENAVHLRTLWWRLRVRETKTLTTLDRNLMIRVCKDDYTHLHENKQTDFNTDRIVCGIIHFNCGLMIRQTWWLSVVTSIHLWIESDRLDDCGSIHLLWIKFILLLLLLLLWRTSDRLDDCESIHLWIKILIRPTWWLWKYSLVVD